MSELEELKTKIRKTIDHYYDAGDLCPEEKNKLYREYGFNPRISEPRVGSVIKVRGRTVYFYRRATGLWQVSMAMGSLRAGIDYTWDRIEATLLVQAGWSVVFNGDDNTVEWRNRDE